MRISYSVPQPVQPVDGSPVWTKAQIQRAPNNAGVPGTWATIATVTGSTTGRWFFQYEDDAATVGDWYRHRYTDTAVAAFDDYSVAIQADEFQVILWLMDDIPDTSITATVLRQWVDMVLADLWPEFWLRYPAGSAQRTTATITPVDADVDGSTDERYTIPADLHEVSRVERINKTNKHHEAWCYLGVEWEQEDREIRLFDPNNSYRYVLHGKKRLRDVTDLTEEFFMLVYWMVRKLYLDLRVNQRANTASFLVFDRRTDTTPEQLDKFLTRATFEVEDRKAKLRPQDFTYDIAPAGAV